MPHGEELLVPDIPTTVHNDRPPDAMPGPTSFTTTNSSQTVRCVVGLSKNLTGRGKVMGSRTAVQAVLPVTNSQSQPINQSVCMSPPVVRTVARAASLS